MKHDARWLFATILGLSVAALPAAGLAQSEQPVTVNIKRLSMEMALRLATATIEACREEGVQVSVTVVDRGGHPQVVLRDVLAMPLSLEVSQRKAYTAMSFNSPTSGLGSMVQSALNTMPGMMFGAGGLPITVGGAIVGGVGVSGAPSGETDEKCARAGLDEISLDLEMGGF